MEESYPCYSSDQQQLKLIQYYALFDPNCEQGLIQGLRYYPRDQSTVIPNNPKLNSCINHYKPYTNPKVVLPKPRYYKNINKGIKSKNNITAINTGTNNIRYNDVEIGISNRMGKNDYYRTVRRSYSNERENA